MASSSSTLDEPVWRPSSPPVDPETYADLLDTMHRAQGALLSRIVREAGIDPGMRVLDVGCGKGFFAQKIAEAVGPRGKVVGLDLDEASLVAAEAGCRSRNLPCEFVRGSATKLPWPKASFDVTFSALCFFDFVHPVQVIAEMKRVTVPGGGVVVVEHDSNHQALLPFPPQLEIALNAALRQAALEKAGVKSRFYAARRLPEWLAQQGLENVLRTSYCADMCYPLSLNQRRYVELFVAEVARHAEAYLSDTSRQQLQAWCQGQSTRPGPEQSGFAASFFHFVTMGRIPHAPHASGEAGPHEG